MKEIKSAFRSPVRFHAVVAAAVLALGACAGGASTGDVRIEHVHGLAIDGETLYVATHHGLMVREGNEWSRRSEDGNDHMGFSFVSKRLLFRSGHPETGGNLGVQRSTDGGRSWETMSNVLDSPVDFHAMAAGRDRPIVLFGWSQGLFRSVGDPKRWEPLSGQGLPAAVGALAAGAEGIVYASTSAGLFRSNDRGDTWKPRSDEVVFAVAVSGDSDEIYASRANSPGVLRSTDGGKTWRDANSGLDAEGVIVALATDGRKVVAADQNGGIWQSPNGGEGWSRVPTP